MPTANERRALWFLALVAISGSVVRLVRARPTPASGAAPDAQIEHQLARIDSARQRQAAASKRGPHAGRSRADTIHAPRQPQPPDPVDLDEATARELETLPGIGPSLAERIVAYRDSVRGIGSFAVLCRIKGVGPGMVAELRKRVIFSGIPQVEGGCEAVPTPPSKSHVTKRGKPR